MKRSGERAEPEAPGADDVAVLARTSVRAPVRRAWVAPFLIALASTALVGWSFTLRGFDQAARFLLAFLGGLCGAAIAAFVAARWATQPPRLARRVTLTRAEIVGVEIVRSSPARALLYDRRLDAYEWRPHGAEAAEAIEQTLARVGLAPRDVVARFHAQPLVGPWEALVPLVGMMVAFEVIEATHGPVLVVLIPLLAYIALCATRSGVLVGGDGVHVRWMWRRLFAPIGAVERCEPHRLGVALRFAGGRAWLLFMRRDEARRLRDRVEAARAALDASERPAIEPILARGDRALGAWIADLRRVLGERTYREAPVSAVVLWRIVEDATRPAVDRAAAAIAVASGDPSARARIAEIARATASPELRAVLAAVAANGADGADGGDDVEAPLARLAP